MLPAAPQNCTWQSYRLPTIVLPDAYRLTLQTVLEDQSTVTGRVEINLHSEEPTRCIVMHAVAMSIDSIMIISSEGSAQQGAPIDAISQQITLLRRLPNPCHGGIAGAVSTAADCSASTRPQRSLRCIPVLWTA